MSSITAYLCASPILFTNTPSYDDKGRQQPYAESRLQRRERLAFVKSLQWQRNVATWMHEQHHTASVSQSPSPDVPSSSSSESSSPRTPASPLNTPHTHTHKQHKQALDAGLAKLALASTVVQSTLPYPEQRQPHKRNYKNLHLANTTHTPRYQPRTRVPQQQPRVQAPSPLMRTPTRGIFDSSSYTYPSATSYPPAEDEDQMDGGEPYIFYSSTPSKRSSPTVAPAAGIGEFPCPPLHTSSSIQTSPLQSPSSSSHPRTLTTVPPTKPRQIGDH